MLEVRLLSALEPLVEGRAYLEAAPKDTPRPYIVFAVTRRDYDRTLNGPVSLLQTVLINLYGDRGDPVLDFSALIERLDVAIHRAGGLVEEMTQGIDPELDLRRCEAEVVFRRQY